MEIGDEMLPHVDMKGDETEKHFQGNWSISVMYNFF